MLENKKGQQVAIGVFISLLVLAVVGITVTLSTANDLVSDTTDTNSVTDENVSAINGTTITLDNAPGNFIVENSENVTNTDNNVTLTKNENYTINYDDGKITWTNVNNTDFGNFSFVDYEYRDDSYVDDQSTRTILDIIPLLIGVAVLLFVVSLGITRFA